MINEVAGYCGFDETSFIVSVANASNGELIFDF